MSTSFRTLAPLVDPRPEAPPEPEAESVALAVECNRLDHENPQDDSWADIVVEYRDRTGYDDGQILADLTSLELRPIVRAFAQMQSTPNEEPWAERLREKYRRIVIAVRAVELEVSTYRQRQHFEAHPECRRRWLDRQAPTCWGLPQPTSPLCGHSACRQHWIDGSDGECVETATAAS